MLGFNKTIRGCTDLSADLSAECTMNSNGKFHCGFECLVQYAPQGTYAVAPLCPVSGRLWPSTANGLTAARRVGSRLLTRSSRPRMCSILAASVHSCKCGRESTTRQPTTRGTSEHARPAEGLGLTPSASSRRIRPGYWARRCCPPWRTRTSRPAASCRRPSRGPGRGPAQTERQTRGGRPGSGS